MSTVAIICGGKSTEHQVSLRSAQGIFAALSLTDWQPVLLAQDQQGIWRCGTPETLLVSPEQPDQIAINTAVSPVLPVTDNHKLTLCRIESDSQESTVFSPKEGIVVDVCFPIIHGTDGEDGALQGWFRMMDTPFVGAGVLGSAICMDKVFTKQLLHHAGLAVVPYRAFSDKAAALAAYAETKQALQLPLFIKPACLGSSVGVARVESEAAFKQAIHTAFTYDDKVLIEEAIEGRELECAVLGSNVFPQYAWQASVLGEVVPNEGDFYSYQAKYLDEKGVQLHLPAKVSDAVLQQAQHMAIQAVKVLECEGLARVDFFLQPARNKQPECLYINEINTLPGFTSISMYPKLWEISGLPYPELLDKLLNIAMVRHHHRKTYQRDFTHS